jgi:dTDP-glucose 4,6-dehydratase
MANRMNEFWRGKKVLVTGGAGFIGSHLTEKLVQSGADVTVIDKADIMGREPNLSNLKSVTDKIKVIHGNVGSNDIITTIIKNSPEVILHLGAIAYVNYSFDHPFEVINDNYLGTLNILQAAMNLDVERVVVTSSSEVYGTAQYSPIDEKHPLNPTSPYAASKAAADRTAFSFCLTYGMPISIIRPFNTYGPRHTYDVIPKFIKLALKGQPLTIYGAGDQSRDFTYVDDMVRGFLLMGSHKSAVGEVVNFGFGKDFSINHTAELIVKLSKSTSKIVHIEKRMAEVNRLICDNRKAQKLFGWEPEVSLEEGLRRNIEFEKISNKNS